MFRFYLVLVLTITSTLINRQSFGIGPTSQQESACKKFVNFPDLEGNTALHLVSKSHLERNLLRFFTPDRYQTILAILIDNGADVNAVNKAGDTPLHLAVKMDSDALVKILIERASVNEKNTWGETPLHIFSKKGFSRSSIGRLLIDKGADVEARSDLKDQTPLHCAVQRRLLTNTELIRLLIEKGANIEAVDSEGATPLLLAVKERSDEAVKILVEKGAKITDEIMKCSEINKRTDGDWGKPASRIKIYEILNDAQQKSK